MDLCRKEHSKTLPCWLLQVITTEVRTCVVLASSTRCLQVVQIGFAEEGFGGSWCGCGRLDLREWSLLAYFALALQAGCL